MNTFRRLVDELLGKQISSRTDLIEQLDEARDSSLISLSELVMIRGVLALFDQKVADARIAVGKVAWMRLGDPLAKMISEISSSGHSRYPVLDDDEKLVGILHVKHLLGGPISDQSYCLEPSLLQQAKKVPESKRLDSMLRDFQRDHVHMAVVADEAGRMIGVITLEDVIERIVGAIRDEFDADEAGESSGLIRQDESRPNRWQVRGDVPIAQFNKTFGTSLDTASADTVGGWFARAIGDVPKPGDTHAVQGCTLEVTAADERRALAFSVETAPDSGSAQPA